MHIYIIYIIIYEKLYFNYCAGHQAQAVACYGCHLFSPNFIYVFARTHCFLSIFRVCHPVFLKQRYCSNSIGIWYRRLRLLAAVVTIKFELLCSAIRPTLVQRLLGVSWKQSEPSFFAFDTKVIFCCSSRFALGLSAETALVFLL